MPSSRVSRLLSVALSLAVLLAVFGGLHRWTLDALAETGDHDGVVSRRLAAYEQLAQLPPGAIVFTGTSQMREAIDPDAFHSAAPTLNLGASAKNPCRALPEVLRIVEAQPSVVVIGVSYFDLSDATCDVPHAALVGAAGGILPAALAPGLMEHDRRAVRLGARVPWRATRPWIVTMLRRALLRTPPLTPDPQRPWRYEGRSPEPLDVLLARAAAAPRLLQPPPADATALVALEAAVDSFAAAGIRVVLVAMPLHPGVTALRRPDGAHDVLLQRLEDIASRHDARVVDLEDAAPAAAFYDVTHLNQVGRVWFSETITAAVVGGAR